MVTQWQYDTQEMGKHCIQIAFSTSNTINDLLTKKPAKTTA
jgi:hypothetical protein